LCVCVYLALQSCRLWCKSCGVHREMLQIGPLMQDRAEFNSNMRAVMLSDSVCEDLERVHRDMGREMRRPCRTIASPIWQKFDHEAYYALNDSFLFVPIWIHAALSMLALPALVKVAPLCCCALAVSMMARQDALRSSRNNEALCITCIATLLLALAAAIFLLGLQLDGVLHLPITVAVVFEVLVALMGIGFLRALDTIPTGRIHTCRTGLPYLPRSELIHTSCTGQPYLSRSALLEDLGLLVGCLSVAIAALLGKVTGGILGLEAIPYSVIYLVLILCVVVFREIFEEAVWCQISVWQGVGRTFPQRCVTSVFLW